MDSTIDVFVRKENTLSVGRVPKFFSLMVTYIFPLLLTY